MYRLKCFECSQLFDNKNDIGRHLKFTHKFEDNVNIYKCVINLDGEETFVPCTEEFSTLRSLFVHADLCILQHKKNKGKFERNNNIYYVHEAYYAHFHERQYSSISLVSNEIKTNCYKNEIQMCKH